MANELSDKQVQEGVSIISKGVAGLVSATKSQAALKKVLADEHATRLLTTTLTSFVGVDLNFGHGMKAIGQICANLLDMPEELQRDAIKKLCEAQGVPVVEETGRKGLSMALFANFPEMQQKVKGNTDTKGMLRISSYIFAFKHGMPGERGKGGKGGGKGKGGSSAKGLFLAMYTNATTAEQSTLVRVAGRAGIEFEDWLPEEGTDPADKKGKDKKGAGKKK